MKNKRKLVLKKNIKKMLNKIMILIIIYLCIMIAVKEDNNLKEKIQNILFSENIKFTKFRNLYEKYLGNINMFNNELSKTKPVFNEKINYKSKREYKNGLELVLEDNYLIPALESGIITYIGNNQEYGQHIKIEQINGIEVYYSNVRIKDYRLYDYIEKGQTFSTPINNKIYIYFKKNGEIINYNKYI